MARAALCRSSRWPMDFDRGTVKAVFGYHELMVPFGSTVIAGYKLVRSHDCWFVPNFIQFSCFIRGDLPHCSWSYPLHFFLQITGFLWPPKRNKVTCYSDCGKVYGLFPPDWTFPCRDAEIGASAMPRCLQFSSRVPKETCWKCENLGERDWYSEDFRGFLRIRWMILWSSLLMPRHGRFYGVVHRPQWIWAQDISPWFPTLSLFWFLLETLICMYYWGKWGESPGYPLRVSLKMRSQQVLCRKALKKERAANIETKSHRIHSN